MASGPVRVFATFYIFGLMLTSWVISFLLQAIVGLFIFAFVSKAKRELILGHIFRKVSAIVVIKLNPFWKLRVSGKLPASSERTIVVINHLSNADPFFMTAALWPWETKYISKSGLFNVPFGGWCMTLSGDVPIYFTSEKGGWGTKKGTIGKMMEHLKQLLGAGGAIAVFPEGGRSPDGQMKEFKPGMFQLASDTGATIVPVGITGTQKAWPVRDWRFDITEVSAVIGDAIPVQQGEDATALRDRVRAKIVELHDQAVSSLGGKSA